MIIFKMLWSVLKVLLPLGLIFFMAYLADKAIEDITQYSWLVYLVFILFAFLVAGFAREQDKINKMKQRAEDLKVEGIFNDIED